MPRPPKTSPAAAPKKLASQQSVNSAVKSVCDIMRRSNCGGSMQYVPELTWILFLRILDEREAREAEEAEAMGLSFTPALPTAGGTGRTRSLRGGWIRRGACGSSSTKNCCRISRD